MENISPLNVPALLRQFNLRPDKRLGQNFLMDDHALRKITDIAEIAPDEVVLEIGPGLGSLTRHLARKAHQVVAVELDERLIPALRHVLDPYPNVRIVQGDILRQDIQQLVQSPAYLVVANIPYYITSLLIRRLLEAPLLPKRLVLTVQMEVAERICAEPGKLSLLALSVQVYGQPRVRARLPAEAFHPTPKVASAVVRVDLHTAPRIPPGQLEAFFHLAKAGFSQKRKTIKNALAAGMRWTPAEGEAILKTAGIDPQRRAESLSLDEWAQLVDAVEKGAPES
ncbi:MAG TPA: 16S rRNA (adenine(1518)-N(6)/adenine(1519)-N(6))-dimethyltransferase RsmA [Anaerolineales bacterium]|nr:16S rRNA (adenine(1518)-N(6)/adenine(1519)-N(6))-dimethyltransferase RsmA [Anaerolineales bacterium]